MTFGVFILLIYMMTIYFAILLIFVMFAIMKSF